MILLRIRRRSSLSGGTLSLPPQREIAREVKVKLRYCFVDYDVEFKSTSGTDKEETQELPDGNFIAVGAKRFHCVSTFLLHWYKFRSTFTVDAVGLIATPEAGTICTKPCVWQTFVVVAFFRTSLCDWYDVFVFFFFTRVEVFF